MIGNWVKNQAGDIFQIFEITPTNYPIEGIPLSEDILLKCGATRVICKKTGIRAQYSISGIKLDLSNSGLVYLSYRSICIPYLHNLQNLFSSLNTPLTFKP